MNRRSCLIEFDSKCRPCVIGSIKQWFESPFYESFLVFSSYFLSFLMFFFLAIRAFLTIFGVIFRDFC